VKERRDDLPSWMLRVGWPVLLIAGLLAIEAVWEQTFLTWLRGPQMVGFAVAHIFGPLLLLGLLCVLLSHLWAVVALTMVIRYRLWRRKATMFLLVATIAIPPLVWVPYEAWLVLMHRTVGLGGHVEAHFSQAASSGYSWLVDELLTSQPALSQQLGGAALILVASRGETDMVRVLLRHGVPLDSVDEMGLRAIDRADMNAHGEIVELLQKAGARPSISVPDG